MNWLTVGGIVILGACGLVWGGAWIAATLGTSLFWAAGAGVLAVFGGIALQKRRQKREALKGDGDLPLP